MFTHLMLRPVLNATAGAAGKTTTRQHPRHAPLTPNACVSSRRNQVSVQPPSGGGTDIVTGRQNAGGVPQMRWM